MRAIVLDNTDCLNRGRVLVAEGWAEPITQPGVTVTALGTEVWVETQNGILWYRKIRETS